VAVEQKRVAGTVEVVAMSDERIETERVDSVRQHLEAIAAQLTDPVHVRLVRAYAGEDPKASMESELGRILREVLESAD
jgi:hypothetical protein